MTEKEYLQLRHAFGSADIASAADALSPLLLAEAEHGLRWVCALCYLAGVAEGRREVPAERPPSGRGKPSYRQRQAR
ncbi:MAG: hypothetical protein WDA00_06370 [Eubacteriales bacterium]